MRYTLISVPELSTTAICAIQEVDKQYNGIVVEYCGETVAWSYSLVVIQ